MDTYERSDYNHFMMWYSMNEENKRRDRRIRLENYMEQLRCERCQIKVNLRS